MLHYGDSKNKKDVIKIYNKEGKQIDNLVKHCRVCGCKLILGMNWLKSQYENSNYICRYCHNKKNKDWYKDNPYYMNNWLKSHPEYDTNKWRRNNPEKYKASQGQSSNRWNKAHVERLKFTHKRYNQTEKGKIVHRKSLSKRRGLGDTLLFNNPFSKNVSVVEHHISDGFMVYIPKDLHLKHYHGRYTELHRDELKPFIECIYNISYIIL